MSFERITKPAMTVANITPLQDRPRLTAAQLKAKFDDAGVDIAEYLSDMTDELNGLIDALEHQTGAENLGASPLWAGESSADNIQAKFTALRAYMDGLVITAGAGDMLKSVFATLEPQNKKVDKAVNADNLGGKAAAEYAKEINGRDAKTTLDDNDAFPVSDAEDGGAQKKTLWSAVKNAMQAAFALVFAAKSHNHAVGDLSGVAAASHTHNYAQLSGVAAESHTHGAGDLSGVAKNTAGVRVSVQSAAPSSPAVNDLWFWDESAS